MNKMKTIVFKGGGTLVYKRERANKAVEAELYISPGARIDGEQYGISHFFEHMLFNGTLTKSKQDLLNLERKYNSEQNAATSPNRVCLNFYCQTKKFEDVMQINAEMLLNPKFEQAELEREKNVVIEEIYRSYDNDQRNISILQQNASIGERQINYPSLGEIKTIQAITLTDLQNYYNKWINKSNFAIYVIGNISLRRVKKAVQKYFIGHLKHGVLLDLPNPNDAMLLPHSRLAMQYKDRSKVNIRIMFPSYGFLASDKIKTIERFFNVIVNNQGIIMRKLRYENGLVYGSGLNISKNMHSGTVYFDISTSSENAVKAVNVTAELVAELLTKGVSQDDIIFAKNYFKSQQDKQTPFIKGKLQRLAFMHQYSIPEHNKSYWEKLEKSITAHDINQYIQTVFKTSQIYVSVFGKIDQSNFISIAQLATLFGVAQTATDAKTITTTSKFSNGQTYQDLVL